MLELHHLAQIIGAWEAQGAVLIPRHGVVRHFFAHSLREFRRHVAASEVLARGSYGLADMVGTLAEDPRNALADVLGGDAG